MTTDALTQYAVPSQGLHLRRKAGSLALVLAGYDLMLAVMIIMAGSQGIHRFVPPLLVWLAIYALVALKYATHLRTLFNVMRENLAIFTFPLVALLSTVWSVSPGASAYSGVQLIVTYMAGLWLGWRYRPGDIAFVMVLALSPLVALSLVNWLTGMFGEVYASSGGLLGIFSNKNTLGRMALLLGVVTFGLLIGRRNRPMVTLALLGIFTMSALALALSKSATSTVVMIGTAALFLALSLHLFRVGTRLVVLLVGALGLMGIFAVMAFGNIDLVDEVLGALGKSSNLTGRTSIWGLAGQQIAAQPWLGVGFDAYWDSNTFLVVDRIQRSFGNGLISFHNFVLDIWVVLGLAGIVAITLTLGSILLTYWRYYAISRDVWGAMMLAIFVAAIGVALFNPLLHAQHGNMIVILIAFTVSARIETRRLSQQRHACARA